jgi:hypothetical protein
MGREAKRFRSDDQMHKKGIVLMVVWFALSPLFPVPFGMPEAEAETRVTISFAAGGVACGLFFFVHLVFRSSLALDPGEDQAALLTYSQQGWKTAAPALSLFREERGSRPFSIRLSETWQAEVIRFRF